MSKRKELEKEIAVLNREIEMLESKRERSIAALIDSLVSKEEPNDSDVNYFRTYSTEIDVKREQIKTLEAQLKKTR